MRRSHREIRISGNMWLIKTVLIIKMCEEIKQVNFPNLNVCLRLSINGLIAVQSDGTMLVADGTELRRTRQSMKLRCCGGRAIVLLRFLVVRLLCIKSSCESQLMMPSNSLEDINRSSDE